MTQYQLAASVANVPATKLLGTQPKGFNATGGAKGVGQATTEAMVTSALSIFILDFIVGVLLH